MGKLNEQNFYKLIKLSSKPAKATADTKKYNGKAIFTSTGEAHSKNELFCTIENICAYRQMQFKYEFK